MPGSVAVSPVDLLMQAWRMAGQSSRIEVSVRKVLSELAAEACLALMDPGLEVMVLPELTPGRWDSVWAYFPIHRRRVVAQKLRPKPGTRVLLVFSTADAEHEPCDAFEIYLRDHLGHVLLFLRAPRAPNECVDAEREWLLSLATR